MIPICEDAPGSPAASRRMQARYDESVTSDEARAALEGTDEASIRAAIRILPGEEVYSALRWHVEPLPFLWLALASEPARADPRWLEGITRLLDAESPGRERGTLEFVFACARDPDHETALRAFEKLFRMLHQSESFAMRGWACDFLGRLRNPRATPELVEEMLRPASVMALYCIPALERCGDGTALPALRASFDGTFGQEARRAADAIVARAGRLDFEQIRCARAHSDPTIVELAKRAQLGDEEAYVVLEDALRA